jgi:hypothetical protein
MRPLCDGALCCSITHLTWFDTAPRQRDDGASEGSGEGQNFAPIGRRRRRSDITAAPPDNLRTPPQQRAADADNRPSHLREVTCRIHLCPRSHLHLRRLETAGCDKTPAGLITFIGKLAVGCNTRSLKPLGSALAKHMLMQGEIIDPIMARLIKDAIAGYGRESAPYTKITKVYGSYTKEHMWQLFNYKDFEATLIHRANIVAVIFIWALALRSADLKDLRVGDMQWHKSGCWVATIIKRKNGAAGFCPENYEKHYADTTFNATMSQWMSEAGDEDQLLFPYFSTDFIRDRLRRLAKACNFNQAWLWTIHALRFGSARTVLLEMPEGSTDKQIFKAVARRTGHMSASMALMYARAPEDRVRDQMEPKVRRLFDKALELPAAARAAFLESKCGHDTELKQRLMVMLAAAGFYMCAIHLRIAARKSMNDRAA